MGTDSLQIENDMKEKKYHFVYKITNLINGKYYIGKHSTNKLEDGYLGKGTAIKLAVAKYGKESFKRDILKFLDTEQDAYDYEQTIVTPELLNDPMCYNLMEGGGSGGVFSEQTRKKMSESRTGKPSHPSTIEAISKSVKGTHFYNNGTESKRFLEGEEPDGWVRGRHMNINTNRKPLSEERKAQLSKRLKGKVPKANLMKIECPHCGKVGQPANMKRWHFDNCGKIRTLSINNKTYECKCGLITNNPGAFSKHKKVCKVK